MKRFWDFFCKRSPAAFGRRLLVKPATTYHRFLAVHMFFARGRSAMEL